MILRQSNSMQRAIYNSPKQRAIRRERWTACALLLAGLLLAFAMAAALDAELKQGHSHHTQKESKR